MFLLIYIPVVILYCEHTAATSNIFSARIPFLFYLVFDPCIGLEPCQNNATCVSNATDQYECLCDVNFGGTNCETGVNPSFFKISYQNPV